MTSSVLQVYETKEAAAQALAQEILESSRTSIAQHNMFSIALSGGSMPKMLAQGFDALSTENQETLRSSTSKWHVFYADERCVPVDDDDSNHNVCSTELFSKKYWKTPMEQIHTIQPSDASAPPTKLAENYQQDILRTLGDPPQLDMVLLGMGPDGHTASLFPSHPLVGKTDANWIESIEDSPKPPSSRITMTLPLINRSRRVVALVSGRSKQEALQNTLNCLGENRKDEKYPVTYIDSPGDSFQIFADQGAANSGF
eukprot:gb/GECG01016749.1/.p1 GENE.gb/GECG01016749.1/~~gb/GECG01016749.1/.p1  ORF type:complete len:257 (+),score=31.47 gb/GECG01016749.1/:1-771(+)